MKYICPKFPFLSFYVGDTKYQFYGGVFDLSEYSEEEHPAIVAALKKTAPDSGVMQEEEYELPYKCDFCEKRFETPQAKNGHKPSHKTKEVIDNESWREGGAPRSES